MEILFEFKIEYLNYWSKNKKVHSFTLRHFEWDSLLLHSITIRMPVSNVLSLKKNIKIFQSEGIFVSV